MNRWCGKIGFAEQVETSQSVWTEEITERTYRGDILRNTRRLQNSQQINDDISISNQISVIGDAYMRDHFINMRWIEFMGAKWKAAEVDASQPPRACGMRTRLDFDRYLRDIVGEGVSVYFQPPSNVSGAGQKVIKNIKYPAIIYSLDEYNTMSANNKKYSVQKEYGVTLITKDPDSDLPDKLVMVPTSRFDRNYESDGLYHSVFTIIF